LICRGKKFVGSFAGSKWGKKLGYKDPYAKKPEDEEDSEDGKSKDKKPVSKKGKRGALLWNATKKIGIKVLQGAMKSAQSYVTQKISNAIMDTEVMERVLKAAMRSLRSNMEYSKIRPK
jgi:hypothetical protein